MTKTFIHVTVRGQVATLAPAQPLLVCGNSHYRIRFAFDEVWADHAKKVARFISKGEFTDVEFTGDEVDVPPQVGTYELKVGVYTDGGPFTTSSAVIPCKLSVLCEDADPSVENDGHYANEAREAANEAREAREFIEGAVDQTQAGMVANAFRASAEGSKVTLTDVSPLSHRMDVRLTSDNLIPFPYRRWPYLSQYGIEHTVHADGSITLNGENQVSDSLVLRLYEGANFLAPGTYSVRCIGTAPNYLYLHCVLSTGSKVTYLYDTLGGGKTFTITADQVSQAAYCEVYVTFPKMGAKYDNLTIYPMIVKGDVIPDKYIAPVHAGAVVKRYGATPDDCMETYESNADGTLKVTSLYPVTTLEAPEGMQLSVQYNQDTLKAVDEAVESVADGRYVTKVTTRGDRWRLYAINAYGEQVLAALDTAAKPYTLANRGADCTFEVGEPQKDAHPATKKYVEEGFVAKQDALVSGAWGVYTCKDDGSTTLLGATYGTNGSIPMRGAGGTVVVGEPAAANHATTRAFVENIRSELLSLISNSPTPSSVQLWKAQKNASLETLTCVSELPATGEITRLYHMTKANVYISTGSGVFVNELHFDEGDGVLLSVLVVDELPSVGGPMNDYRLNLYYNKTDGEVYAWLGEETGYHSASELGFSFQVITSLDEITEQGVLYLHINEANKGLFYYDGKWHELVDKARLDALEARIEALENK